MNRSKKITISITNIKTHMQIVQYNETENEIPQSVFIRIYIYLNLYIESNGKIIIIIEKKMKIY